MPTLAQLISTGRKRKKKRLHSSALAGSPQRRAVCLRAYCVTPKKPNSALRKVARVRTCNGVDLAAYIPGIGHTIHDHCLVMIKGGRVRDLPGCRHRIIRGALDSTGVKDRTTSRSKYGTRRPL
jgi:small subunit ribosomal protein S12